MKWLTRWFDDDVDWYPPCAGLLSVYFLYQAFTQNRWLFEGFPRPSVLSAICGLIFAIGYPLKMPGARWFGIPWLLFLNIAHIINATLNGWSIWNGCGMLAFLVMAVHYVWLYFFEKPALERAVADAVEEEQESNESESEQEGKPFLSLVLLFRESPYLDADVLARLGTKAWDMPMRTGDDVPGDEKIDVTRPSETSAGGIVISDDPPFIIKHPEAILLVHHFDSPYFDDPAAVAEDLVERRVRRAVAEHRAWTSVDVMTWFGDDQTEAAPYRVVARLLAELADDNVLAVVDPAAQQIFTYDPETERKLRSIDPRAELRELYYAPVISVPDEDPAMIAAVEEARRRWPEFVAAFEQRSPDVKSPFIVKAPVGPAGNEEFIWIEVTGIEADTIYGNLGNEPAAIPNLKLGDRVRVPVAKLNDWLCLINGEPCGGFTLKVIAEHARRRRET